MKKLLLATAMLFMFTSAGYAYTVIGEGTQSCGQYVLDYEKFNAPANMNDPFAMNAFAGDMSWVSGFISGYNLATKKNVGEGIDGPAKNLWLVNYCKANPLKFLADAAKALITELDK